MNRNQKIRWISSLILFVCFFSESSSEEKLDSKLYIDSASLKIESILPPPFELGSKESQHELEDMKSIIAKLDSSQKDLAIKDALNLSVSFFSDTLPDFDIDKLPRTKKLFDHVKFNAGYESKLFKNYFMSKRPYQVDSNIQACVPPVPDNLNRSYPSGHTTLGYAMGIILANLIPEKSKQIMERARLYGENRINCGAHYPSDVVGGQVLGTIVAIELLKNNEFKLLMQESKNELALAGITRGI